MAKKKILFIVNPISGVGKQRIVETLVPNCLDQKIFDFEIVYTEYAGHASFIAKNASEDGVDIVVVVGGDGSVNEVAKALVHSGTVMGIVPCGSGNGLARCLKIPMRIENAIKVLNKQKIKTIDTAIVNNEPFFNIAGVGYDALIAGLFAREGKRGLLSYMKVIAESYLRYRQETYEITVNGAQFHRKALFICVANSNQYGYNTFIAPHAKVDDGLLDVCIMRKIPILEAPLLAPLLFSRNIDKSRYIEIIKASEVKIVLHKKHLIHIDGDPMRVAKELDIKIIPKSLHVLIP